jgi:hypothetical protein
VQQPDHLGMVGGNQLADKWVLHKVFAQAQTDRAEAVRAIAFGGDGIGAIRAVCGLWPG